MSVFIGRINHVRASTTTKIVIILFFCRCFRSWARDVFRPNWPQLPTSPSQLLSVLLLYVRFFLECVSYVPFLLSEPDFVGYLINSIRCQWCYLLLFVWTMISDHHDHDEKPIYDITQFYSFSAVTSFVLLIYLFRFFCVLLFDVVFKYTDCLDNNSQRKTLIFFLHNDRDTSSANRTTNSLICTEFTVWLARRAAVKT